MPQTEDAIAEEEHRGRHQIRQSTTAHEAIISCIPPASEPVAVAHHQPPSGLFSVLQRPVRPACCYTCLAVASCRLAARPFRTARLSQKQFGGRDGPDRCAIGHGHGFHMAVAGGFSADRPGGLTGR